MTSPSKEALEAANECLNSGPFKHNSPGRRQAIALALDAFAQQARDAGYVSGLRAARAELETEREEDQSTASKN